MTLRFTATDSQRKHGESTRKHFFQLDIYSFTKTIPTVTTIGMAERSLPECNEIYEPVDCPTTRNCTNGLWNEDDDEITRASE
jgi:hypothetical protein